MTKNKDIDTLRNVLPIMRDIESLEQRRLWQKDRMTNITSHLSWTHGGGNPTGFDAAFDALSDTEIRHKEKVLAYTRELKRAESILNDIPSKSMQTFVEMRYVNGSSRAEIMEALNLTEKRFRTICESIESADSMQSVRWRVIR